MARTLYELLRYGVGARDSVHERWLTVDEKTGEYVVREQKPYARHPAELARTLDETEAVNALDPPEGEG